MPKASVTRHIARDKQTLIDFVLDIEKYPEFIPFCYAAKIHKRREDSNSIKIIADLTIGKGPLPIVRSAIMKVFSPLIFFSFTCDPRQKGTNSGYFSISKTKSISWSFLHPINLLTDSLGINGF